MNAPLVQYEPKDVRTLSLPLEDWKRLLQAADLGTAPQDIRIQDALRYVVLNGEARL